MLGISKKNVKNVLSHAIDMHGLTNARGTQKSTRSLCIGENGGVEGSFW